VLIFKGGVLVEPPDKTSPPVKVPPVNGKAKPETRPDEAATRVSVMFADVIDDALAATATVAKEILSLGVAGADGLDAGVPVKT
jgi:hypothetical protein